MISSNSDNPNDLSLDCGISLTRIQQWLDNELSLPREPSSEANEIILKSFENLKIYIDASKLYGKNYSVDQIKEEYVKRINTMLADKNRLDNLNKPTEQKTEVKVEETPILQDNNISNEPQLKQAGFADVLVLSMIILVYAAIIINLIIKIKHI